jgi:hypothetical protein
VQGLVVKTVRKRYMKSEKMGEYIYIYIIIIIFFFSFALYSAISDSDYTEWNNRMVNEQWGGI